MIWFVAIALASIEVEPAPQVGGDVVITVLDAKEEPRVGETMTVIHRPGLTGERELAIGITDGRGRVSWTPEFGGVAELRAGPERLDVQVTRGHTPRAPLLLLLLAGLVGVVATAYGWSSSATRAKS